MADTLCTRCGWWGAAVDLKGDVGNCPQCGSTWQVDEVSAPLQALKVLGHENIYRVGNEFDLLKMTQDLRKCGVNAQDVGPAIVEYHKSALGRARMFVKTLLCTLGPAEEDEEGELLTRDVRTLEGEDGS